MSIDNPNITNVRADDIIPENVPALMVIPEDFDLMMAQGHVTGHEDVSIVGYNSDIDVGTETIWGAGGTWTPLTSANTLTIVSSSANDTSAGTGARTIRITGVNASRQFQQEVVTMNGVTPVITTSTWLGVNQVLVVSAGSTGYNVGNITITGTAATTVQSYVIATESISQQMVYHQPVGSNLYIDKIITQVDKITGGSQPTVRMNGYIVYPSGVRVMASIDILNPDYIALVDSTLHNKFVVPAGSYFWFQGNTDVNNTFVRMRIDGKKVSA